MLSSFLAELWGISMVIIGLAFLINPKYIERVFKYAEDEKTMFNWGILTLVIGLSMVLSHNIWAKNWQVAITVLGWLSLIKGMVILFVPEIANKYLKKVQVANFLPYALMAVVLIGLVLTYFGFTA